MRGRYYRAKFRLKNAVLDLYERWIDRRCCEYLTHEEGGYNHWRCGRPLGHSGAHRFNNYVWPGLSLPLRVVYDPYGPYEPGKIGGQGDDYKPVRDRAPSDNRRQRWVRKRERDALERRRQEKPWEHESVEVENA